jgi:hypothetical protein
LDSSERQGLGSFNIGNFLQPWRAAYLKEKWKTPFLMMYHSLLLFYTWTLKEMNISKEVYGKEAANDFLIGTSEFDYLYNDNYLLLFTYL